MRLFTSLFFIMGFALTLWLQGCSTLPPNALRVSETNPRYFTDNSGRAVYLTGSHTWNNLVDMNAIDKDEPFDFKDYLRFLKFYNHNFIRLWTWDLLTFGQISVDKLPTHQIDAHPWSRTGPGEALDGKFKFDLSEFNQAYFDRMRERIQAAAKENIYVSVMLFEGWGLQFSPDAFRNHPFHPMNNINDIDLDTVAEEDGFGIYQLGNEKITRLQEAYVSQVIQTVGDLDNVLYEISNENHAASTEWQYHMINYIKDLENQLGNPHPVGMTFQYKGGNNQNLFNSPADWISPNKEGGYLDDPPAGPGEKVILSDTDHLWGIGGNPQWVWKSFLRGLNPIFMDPYTHEIIKSKPGDDWEEIRVAMGYTLEFAEKMDLIHMLPDAKLASSGFCLSNKGKEYLIYIPSGRETEIDLSQEHGNFNVEWFNPGSGNRREGNPINGGAVVKMIAPFDAEDAVVYIKLDGKE